MAFAKRIILFLLTNFLVIAVISFLLYIFNIQPYLTAYGLDYTSLAIFCLIWGMGGALISLAMSRIMAKWMMGVQLIDPMTKDPGEREILQMVYKLAEKAGLPKMPEVGLYQSPELNAFATGPTRSRALVAISTGLLNRMNRDEVEGVVGHEVTHVANGDMVTMTLLQGIVNAFVMFLARIIAFAISRAFVRDRESGEGFSSLSFQLTVFVLQTVFMVLGSIVIAAFCRRRELRADLGGARLAGTEKMIGALQTLKRNYEVQDPQTAQPAIQALKISSPGGFMRLFASHPPLDERIARLQRLSERKC
jgi:heat shock protein HtpX